MVHWIYVLECEDDYIYIGETTRLFRRFREHIYRNGSVNTSMHEPVRLIGLYKLSDNYSFYKYRNEIRNGEYNRFALDDWGGEANEINNLLIENHFTELCMYLRKEDNNFIFADGEWNKVKGGKYTKQIYSNPVSEMNIEDIFDRPTCKCGMPCEVKLNKDKSKILYVCALKNTWEDMEIDVSVNLPCDYFKVYNDDIYIKKQYDIIQEKLKDYWVKNLPNSAYKINPESCISCNKNNYLPIWCYSATKRVCQPCFINKYEELKQKYSINKYKYNIPNECVINEE